MSRFKIVISDYYYPNLDLEREIFKKCGNNVEIVDCTKLIEGGAKTPQQLIPHIKDADALIVQFADINAEVIAAMEKCKVIARYAIGVDIIDIPAASAKGIYVANVPDYCIEEVADTAMGHILNAFRKLNTARDLVLNGAFSMDAIRPIKRLEECTLGLLGFGNIARNLSRKAYSFFDRILASDPYFERQSDYPGVTFVDFETLLKAVDVLSIHVPLNDSTRHMISDSAFALMQDGVVIVNTARGDVLDQKALLAALESGKVGFCGLDVISDENFMDSPLLRHPKIMLTPHISWYSEGARVELQRKTAENVVQTLLTGQPVYAVNFGAFE
jgi:D-3-phosphoglycerate dehydrogenase